MSRLSETLASGKFSVNGMDGGQKKLLDTLMLIRENSLPENFADLLTEMVQQGYGSQLNELVNALSESS